MSERADPVPSRLSFAAGSFRIFELSLGEMLWSRRTVFLVLVTAAPVFLALVARVVQASGIAPLRVNGATADAGSVFGTIIWLFYVWFIVPVLAVFYGTALIADEVEDRTLTYLFTRPIRRGAVLVGKYLAYVVSSALVILPSVVLVYFLTVPFGQIGPTFTTFAADLGLLALGLTAYGALFALVGAVFRRPLVSGLVFVIGWEQLALLVPGSLRYFTIAYYVQGLVGHAMPSEGLASVVQNLTVRGRPDALLCVLALVAISAAALALGVSAVERREYVLDQ